MKGRNQIFALIALTVLGMPGKGYASEITNDSMIISDGTFDTSRYLQVGEFGDNGLAPVEDRSHYWGYIDRDGEQVIDCIYAEAEPFGENGLAKTRLGIYYGIINELGVTVVPFSYDEIGEFAENGYVRVRKGGRVNFVSSFGQLLYDSVGEPTQKGVSIAKKKGRYFFVDESGNRVNENTYDVARALDGSDVEGFLVRIGTKYGLVDDEGTETVPVEYDRIDENDTLGLFEVQVGKHRGVASIFDGEILETKYKTVDICAQTNDKGKIQFAIIRELEDGTCELINSSNDKVVVLGNRLEQRIQVEKMLLWGDKDGKEIWISIRDEDDSWSRIKYDYEGEIQEIFGNVRERHGFPYDVVCEVLIEDGSLTVGYLEDRYLAYLNEKVGIISSSGEIIIPIENDDIRFYYGCFHVEKSTADGTVFTYTDIDGNILSSEEADVYESQQRFLREADDAGYVTKTVYVDNEFKCGYVDESLEYVIPPQFDLAWPFTDGVAVVQIDGQMMLINEKGQLLTSRKYDYIYDLETSGYRKVEVGDEYGLIDNSGKEVLPPYYEYIFWTEDPGYYEVKQNGLYGVMDIELRWIITPVFPKRPNYNSKYEIISGKDEKDIIQHYKKNGQELLVSEDWKSSVSDEGLITSTIGDRYFYTFYDTEGNAGEWLTYEAVSKLIYGLAGVKEDGRWGFIDAEGDEIIPCEYTDADFFSKDGLAAVFKNGGWGFIDEANNVVVDFQYEKVSSFQFGRAAVCRDGLWGYIDAEGNEVIPPQYESADDFSSNGTASVRKEGDENDIKIDYFGETSD